MYLNRSFPSKKKHVAYLAYMSINTVIAVNSSKPTRSESSSWIHLKASEYHRSDIFLKSKFTICIMYIKG